MQKLLRMMHKKEEGFTLVELMVVVVILGVLVAIGIALFADIGDDAIRNANEANLRTIDGSIAMFRASEGSVPTTVQQLVGADLLMENPDCPRCGAAGAYGITDGRAAYTCDEAGCDGIPAE